MKRENIIKYGNPILLVALVAILGSIFTNSGLDWFSTLNKPSNWIPNYVIPIVWSIIYSAFTIYIIYLVKHNKLSKCLKILLIINGILNVIWCFIYFGLQNILLGLIVIVLNLILSIILSLHILLDNKKWGYLLIIYPTWLTIATCLNLATWILN